MHSVTGLGDTKSVMSDVTNDNFNNSNLLIRYKIVFVGDISVGKTSIIHRFNDNKFKDTYEVRIFNISHQLALTFLLKLLNFLGKVLKYKYGIRLDKTNTKH